MGTYIQALKDGNNHHNLTDLASDTIMAYARAAALYLETTYNITVPLYLQTGGAHKQNTLNPFLANLLVDRRNWKKKRDKKEPLTGAMLNAMLHLVTSDPRGILSQMAAVYDWCRFGLYTGSRLGEYGQCKPPKQAPADWFATAPINGDVPPDWRGRPLAFIEEDFTFYTDKKITLSSEAVLANHTLAAMLRVRYRYDKSNNNFEFRFYSRRHGNHICVIKAAMSILRRHRMLGRSKDLPLGAFMDAEGKICTIRAKHMEKAIRQSCEHAYPDKNHYLRQHIKRLMSHSIRVFACVALKDAGVAEEDIVYRLRWNSDAVKFYTRDCYRLSDTLTGLALLGAFHDDWTGNHLSTPSLHAFAPNIIFQ